MGLTPEDEQELAKEVAKRQAPKADGLVGYVRRLFSGQSAAEREKARLKPPANVTGARG